MNPAPKRLCTWCGHPLHDGPCPTRAYPQGLSKPAAPCPCARHLKGGRS